jgi:hypothetical protein
VSGVVIDHDRYRGAIPMLGMGLDVDDAYAATDPLQVRARPTEDPLGRIVAAATDVSTGQEVKRTALERGDDGWYTAELGPLPEGVYRITAFGEGMVEPVTDLVSVFAT